jgi:hypothetical protein
LRLRRPRCWTLWGSSTCFPCGIWAWQASCCRLGVVVVVVLLTLAVGAAMDNSLRKWNISEERVLLSVEWQCVHCICIQVKKISIFRTNFNSNKKYTLLTPDLFIIFFHR